MTQTEQHAMLRQQFSDTYREVSAERRERYWRREAEHQAQLVRIQQELVIFERNRSRWSWWMWGVLVGTLIGWCLAMWRLN